MSQILTKIFSDSGLFQMPRDGMRETPKGKRSKADSARRKAAAEKLARSLAKRKNWSDGEFEEEKARLQLEIEEFLERKREA
ncbi:hypothetical protein [Sulfitobacter litoralis]|uniref:hypothetical protein n=1 Tax=Sulfitobacter litoralis TaxID=335975 RepID=UPI002B278123|nr:hypothetical protein [Sulfitobacter litoralis]